MSATSPQVPLTEEEEARQAGQRVEEEVAPTYIKAELPPFHCKYCFLHDPLAVAQCTICNSWFCNGTGAGANKAHRSHLIHHFLLTHHEGSVRPHATGPFGDNPVECFGCGSKSLFSLGMVSQPEDQVLILCREKCQPLGQVEHYRWDPTQWKPLVVEFKLAPWLIKQPTDEEQRRCRVLSRKQMKGLEDLWATTPQAELDDLPPQSAVNTLPPVPLRFEGEDHFIDTFKKLLGEEINLERLQSATIRTQVTATLKPDLLGVGFTVSVPGSVANAYNLGNMVGFTLNGKEFTALIYGSYRRGGRQEVELKVRSRDPDLVNARGPVSLVLSPSPNFAPWSRMLRAMKAFTEDTYSVSRAVYRAILGDAERETRLNTVRPIPQDLNVAGLPTLNPSQLEAIRHVLDLPVGLIQGPPGTGKTTTCAALVYHMRQTYDAQVLCAATSNVAVDHLATRIAKTGLKVVRVFAKSREDLPSDAADLGLHTLVRQKIERESPNGDLAKLMRLRAAEGNLLAEDYQRYKKLLSDVEIEILASADVICATCIGSGDPRLLSFRFKHALIDEATQSIEPECLIPIVTGTKQIILVGDHCQLGPVVKSRNAEIAGLGRSLFERLVLLETHPPIRLEIQYRMHPAISEFPSLRFYEGRLQNGVTARDRQPQGEFPWPNTEKPTIFIHCATTSEESGVGGASFLNQGETQLVLEVIEHLTARTRKVGIVNPKDIGIITPYVAQRDWIIDRLEGRFPSAVANTIEVASVDAFQGREKDFIVLSCVRANDDQGVGFLSSWQRMNVAITRAKRGLIVVGNAVALSKHVLWHAFLMRYLSEGLLLEGSIAQGLRQSTIALSEPTATTGTNRPGFAQRVTVPSPK